MASSFRSLRSAASGRKEEAGRTVHIALHRWALPFPRTGCFLLAARDGSGRGAAAPLAQRGRRCPWYLARDGDPPTPQSSEAPRAFPDGLPFARPSRPPLERVPPGRAVVRPGHAHERPARARARGRGGRPTRRRARRGGVVVHAGLMLVLRAFTDGPGRRAELHVLRFRPRGRVERARPALRRVRPDLVPDRHRRGGHRDRGRERGAGDPRVRRAVRGRDARDDGREAGIPVVFDAAHVFGALRRPPGRHVRRRRGVQPDARPSRSSPVKAGSSRPTTPISPRRPHRTRHGNPGDYDTRFVGLNARHVGVPRRDGARVARAGSTSGWSAAARSPGVIARCSSWYRASRCNASTAQTRRRSRTSPS